VGGGDEEGEGDVCATHAEAAMMATFQHNVQL
jgi:hypothetical protein